MMSAPMRILHVFGKTNRGGAETFIMNVYRNIDRSKIQFDFMVHTAEKCDYDDEITALGGKIFSVPPYHVINHLEYKSEWQRFFEHHRNYEIIHGHMTSTASIYLKIAKAYGVKTIAHAHSTSSGRGISAIIKERLQCPLKTIADYLFACSTNAGIWCYGNGFCKNPNSFVVNNAIETDKFIYDPEIRKQKRKELNIENKFVIGHVGRLAAPKNHRFLIEIFKEIYKRNNNAVLLLVGDGELRSEVEKKIEAFGLSENVLLIGVRPDIPDLLCAMDVFLFPSLWEGLGIALIESQANGLHCIASDAVPKEAGITNLLENIPLEKDASYWADSVLAYSKGYDRTDMRDHIKKAHYDIKYVSQWLETFYLEGGCSER